MKTPIFSGATKECFQHLGKARFVTSALLGLTQFTETAPSTIAAWTSGKRMPVGEPLMRAQYYLAHLGYDAAELNDLPKLNRQIGELYAFGVLDASHIAQALGYDAREPTAPVFRLIFGKQRD